MQYSIIFVYSIAELAIYYGFLNIWAVLNKGVFNRAVLNSGVFNRAVNLIDIEHSTHYLCFSKNPLFEEKPGSLAYSREWKYPMDVLLSVLSGSFIQYTTATRSNPFTSRLSLNMVFIIQVHPDLLHPFLKCLAHWLILRNEHDKLFSKSHGSFKEKKCLFIQRFLAYWLKHRKVKVFSIWKCQFPFHFSNHHWT